MPIIENAFLDAALTIPFDSGVHKLSLAAVNLASADGSFWFGSANALNQIQDLTNPGIDPIVCSINDLFPAQDAEATDIKLALSQAGLTAAVAGDPVNVGTTVLGGSGNAVRVWYRWTNITGATVQTDLELVLSDRQESAI